MQLGVFFDHRDDLAADLLRQHRHLDVFVVLEAVADDRRVVVGEAITASSSGFEPASRPKLEGLAEFETSSTTWRCWLTLIG
jgi:hypothetical protein